MRNLRIGSAAIPLLLLLLLALMTVRVPPLLLDISFTFNITLALVVLLVAVYVMRPLEFGVESLEDRAREQVVDFCFAQSSELSILSSLSIVLLKGSGDLLTAGPIVFDGAVVPSSCLRDGLDYLGAVIDSAGRSTAMWRHCRAVADCARAQNPCGPRRLCLGNLQWLPING